VPAALRLQVIWGIILGMLAMMAYSIIRNKAFPPPSRLSAVFCSGECSLSNPAALLCSPLR